MMTMVARKTRIRIVIKAIAAVLSPSSLAYSIFSSVFLSEFTALKLRLSLADC